MRSAYFRGNQTIRRVGAVEGAVGFEGLARGGKKGFADEL